MFASLAKMIAAVLVGCVGCGSGESLESRRHAADKVGTDTGAALAGSSDKGVSIQVAEGDLIGKDVDGVLEFLGVPYAEPPVGARRFQAPVPKAAWSQARSAQEAGSDCLQNRTGGQRGSEDCLYLNLWAPKSSRSNLPVMVFLHGGAFDSGSGLRPFPGVALYEGSRLAKAGDVIVVTLNYRLGALGFLAHPALRGAAGQTGNYGLLDQLAALRWVKANVQRFGGNPSNVTIFGESAGAYSVCALATQVHERGLFQRAIMQSGSCQARSVAEQEERGVAFARRLCGDGEEAAVRACLLSAPVERILESQTNLEMNSFSVAIASRLEFLPVVDGHFLKEFPFSAISAGAHAGEMIVGSNANEIPPILYREIRSEEQARRMLVAAGLSVVEAREIWQLYSGFDLSKPAARLAAIATDVQFACPAYEIARARGALAQKTFVYRSSLGMAVHGLELPYLFQSFRGFTPGERHMADLWSSFARSGVPMRRGLALWPTGPEQALHIDSLLVAKRNPRLQACEYLSNTKLRLH